MKKTTTGIASSFGAAIAAFTLAGSALADGMPSGSVKDSPAAASDARKFAFSWNIGATTDYVFRGISQNNSRPAAQGGIDMTYGIFYAGAWGSDVNFGTNAPLGGVGSVANVEIDYYAGIKPVLGPVTFDLGVIYYSYLGGKDKGPRFNQVREQDYTELKLGASATFIPKLTTGITAFFSPQYTGGQGFVTTVEGTIAYELPQTLKITPTISGTLGSSFGDAKDSKDPFVFANGKDSAKNTPSPPNTIDLIEPARTMSKSTSGVIAATQPVSTCSSSPSPSTRSMTQPPTCTNT